MKTQIKFNGWHEVELNGQLLTGDTFKCKDFIKKYLNGTWNGKLNGWIVDTDLVKKYTTDAGTLMAK